VNKNLLPRFFTLLYIVLTISILTGQEPPAYFENSRDFVAKHDYSIICYLITSADYTVCSAHLWLKSTSGVIWALEWFWVMRPLGEFALIFAFHTIVFVYLHLPWPRLFQISQKSHPIIAKCIGNFCATVLNTEWCYITRLRCSACQSQIPTNGQCSHLIGLFT